MKHSHLDFVGDWREPTREAKYRVSEMARLARCSRRCLDDFFRNRYHVSPKHWVDVLRRDDAPGLLAQGLQVREVASALGFASSSYFCRWFGACFGCTPLGFARRSRRRGHLPGLAKRH